MADCSQFVLAALLHYYRLEVYCLPDDQLSNFGYFSDLSYEHPHEFVHKLLDFPATKLNLQAFLLEFIQEFLEFHLHHLYLVKLVVEEVEGVVLDSVGFDISEPFCFACIATFQGMQFLAQALVVA